jgi:endonuclease/exonuclease/phosphatase family metal-dependent hydrolase
MEQRADLGRHGEPVVLKFLSYNIQAALGMSAYSHYVTKSWRHFIPDWRGIQRLDRIARVLSDFDVVALQEVDGGSLRSSFVNQLDYFADLGRFPFHHQQLNRDLGRLGQFSNGLLSRIRPYHVANHSLPGLRGRGAIVAHFGDPASPLLVVCVHLALSERARFRQLHYLRGIIDGHRYVVVLGDLNCASELIVDTPLRDAALVHATHSHPTYPSWKPRRNIDHVLASPALTIKSVDVLPWVISDHLPIAVSLQIPAEVADGLRDSA